MKVNSNYIDVVDEILTTFNLKSKVVLDATCGRGNDSLKLLNKIGEEGFLYACDIQDEAVESSNKILIEAGYNNYKIYKISHEYIFDYISEEIEFIIYNLGYLPKSDKSITTKADSTIKSIEKGLTKISKTGMIVIVSYLGHKESFEERDKLSDYLKNLNQKKYKVEKIEFFNQLNNPPIIFKLGVV